ncbi:MAG TPA: glycosyltransferase family 9 protein [Pseudonocardiaceae bacterium]|jgi:ADP-heptose:LPS heptosyltransferase|nr:glycosyltransferase family 9 protein [Pseudonocardiaceae bacterium]
MSRPEVLVLRALGLGDLLTALPALRGLRRAFPAHRLVLAAPRWLAPLAHPEVDELLDHSGLSAPLPHRPVHIAVNLHGCGPASHALLDALRPARRIGHAHPGWPGPPWSEGEAERHRWCDLLAWHDIPANPGDLYLPPPAARLQPPGSASPPGLRAAAVVHPGAGYPAKRWPPERFAAVAAALAADGHRVVVTGSPTERGLAAQVVTRAGLPPEALLAGVTTLDALAMLVHQATVVVSGDTGIAHLAAAYRTPSVVLFGPVPAQQWGPPPGGPHLALSADAPRRGDPFAADPDPALVAITVPDVLAAARHIRRR